MKDFTEMKPVYRARLDFPDGVTFLSNTTFDNYEECFWFAKEQAKQYTHCGFCVVFSEEPQLTLGITFDELRSKSTDLV